MAKNSTGTLILISNVAICNIHRVGIFQFTNDLFVFLNFYFLYTWIRLRNSNPNPEGH